MTLLVFMYHRASAGRHGNTAALLDAHFGHIARDHCHVLPGEDLTSGRLNICLTFDDGYYDFYAKVFPLLQKHQLKAVLAVPPHVIRERVDASARDRMEIESEAAFAHPSRGGFCTWEEINEMASSGHVQIAAHGFTHQPLDRVAVDMETEIDSPKTILASRVEKPVTSFMFPYGRYSPASLARARHRYRHVFRIGGSLNRSWNERILYRIDADRMPSPTALVTPWRLARYRARYFWNRLRLR